MPPFNNLLAFLRQMEEERARPPAPVPAPLPPSGARVPSPAPLPPALREWGQRYEREHGAPVGATNDETTRQAVANKLWSEDFARRYGVGPTDEDWRRHYEEHQRPESDEFRAYLARADAMLVGPPPAPRPRTPDSFATPSDELTDPLGIRGTPRGRIGPPLPDWEAERQRWEGRLSPERIARLMEEEQAPEGAPYPPPSGMADFFREYGRAALGQLGERERPPGSSPEDGQTDWGAFEGPLNVVRNMLSPLADRLTPEGSPGEQRRRSYEIARGLRPPEAPAVPGAGTVAHFFDWLEQANPFDTTTEQIPEQRTAAGKGAGQKEQIRREMQARRQAAREAAAPREVYDSRYGRRADNGGARPAVPPPQEEALNERATSWLNQQGERFFDWLTEDVPARLRQEAEQVRRDPSGAAAQAVGSLVEGATRVGTDIGRAKAISENLPAELLAAGERIGRGLVGDEGPTIVQPRPPEQDEDYRLAQAVDEWVARNRPRDRDFEESFLASTLPAGVGSTIPFMVTGPVGTLAGIASGAGRGYDEASQAGTPAARKYFSALWGGLLGSTERLPLEKPIGMALGRLGPSASRVIAGATEEAIQETGQTIGENIGARYIGGYDPERAPLTGVAEGGAAGFLTGLLLNLVGAGVGTHRRPADTDTTPEQLEAGQPRRLLPPPSDGGRPPDPQVLVERLPGTVVPQSVQEVRALLQPPPEGQSRPRAVILMHADGSLTTARGDRLDEREFPAEQLIFSPNVVVVPTDPETSRSIARDTARALNMWIFQQRGNYTPREALPPNLMAMERQRAEVEARGDTPEAMAASLRAIPYRRNAWYRRDFAPGEQVPPFSQWSREARDAYGEHLARRLTELGGSPEAAFGERFDPLDPVGPNPRMMGATRAILDNIVRGAYTPGRKAQLLRKIVDYDRVLYEASGGTWGLRFVEPDGGARIGAALYRLMRSGDAQQAARVREYARRHGFTPEAGEVDDTTTTTVEAAVNGDAQAQERVQAQADDTPRLAIVDRNGNVVDSRSLAAPEEEGGQAQEQAPTPQQGQVTPSETETPPNPEDEYRRTKDHLERIKGMPPTPDPVQQQRRQAALEEAERRADEALARVTDRDRAFMEGVTGEEEAEVPGPAAPPPGIPGPATTAFGADPSREYQFRYRIVPLDSLIPSHTDSLRPNPAFPRELQPRDRERAGSRAQVDRIARDLVASALLAESSEIDRGAPIVGSDLVVESGNGRTLALRTARDNVPERWQGYQQALRQRAEELGIDPAALDAIPDPVLVRERVSEVDRVAFAREANEARVLGMSAAESAQQDAARISDQALMGLQAGESTSVQRLLTMAANRPIVQSFLQSLPANERAQLVDRQGALNRTGLERLKGALFAKVYQGGAAERLAHTFTESTDSNILRIEHALFASLPDMARVEGRVREGLLDENLSLAGDIAAAVDMYARLKESRRTVEGYLEEVRHPEPQLVPLERELTPFQEELLQYFDTFGNRSKDMRELLRAYAEEALKQPPPSQTTMFAMDTPTKEEILERLIREQFAERQRPAGPLLETAGAEGTTEATPDTGPRTESEGLAGTPAESVPDAGREVAGTTTETESEETSSYPSALTTEATGIPEGTLRAIRNIAERYEAGLAPHRPLRVEKHPKGYTVVVQERDSGREVGIAFTPSTGKLRNPDPYPGEVVYTFPSPEPAEVVGTTTETESEETSSSYQEPSGLAAGARVQVRDDARNGGRYAGRHGTIENVHGEAGVTVRVRTDSGAVLTFATEDVVPETETPPETVPDILDSILNQARTPQEVRFDMERAERDARNMRDKASRARKPQNKRRAQREADRLQERHDTYKRLLDEWVSQYPEEAARLGITSPEMPSAPTEAPSPAGPDLTEVTLEGGLTAKLMHYENKSGNPRVAIRFSEAPPDDILNELGARRKKALGGWTFWGGRWSAPDTPENNEFARGLLGRLGGEVEAEASPEPAEPAPTTPTSADPVKEEARRIGKERLLETLQIGRAHGQAHRIDAYLHVGVGGQRDIVVDTRSLLEELGAEQVKPGYYRLPPITTQEQAGEAAVEEAPPQSAEPAQQGALFESDATPADSEAISDFGEKIGGARKDLWAGRHLEVRDLDQMTSREADDLVTKDQIWSRPNYEQMVEEGADPVAAYLVKRLYDSIRKRAPTTAPTRTDSEARNDGLRRAYVEVLGRIRDAASRVSTIEDARALFWQVFPEQTHYRRGAARGEAWTEEGARLAAALEQKTLDLLHPGPYDIATAQSQIKRTGWPRKREAWERQYQIVPGDDLRVTTWWRYNDDGTRTPGYAVETPERPGGRSPAVLGRFASREEAEAERQTHAGTFLVLDHKRARVAQGSLPDRDAALEWAREAIRPAGGSADPVRPQLAGITRTGRDVRGGRDVSEQDFQEEFGFRGGEFGNWTSQADRQQSLNHAYDALVDLADALGIPPRAVSLGGELGIAFGARGKGRAAAHYEPSKVVINLTKIRGAGALAHEWAHALDDYFGRLSKDRDSRNPFVSHGVRDTTQMRPEMMAAWNNVMRTIKRRLATEDEAARRVTQNLARERKAITSWLTPWRAALTRDESYGSRKRPAATAEQLAEVDSLISALSEGEGGQEELARLIALYKEVKGVLPDKQARDQLDIWIRSKAYNARNLHAVMDRALEREVDTEYLKNARALDRKRNKGYWAAPHELFARAFESFIYDRLRGEGQRSDYLVHGVTNTFYKEGQLPYPEGEERESINQALQEFVDTLEVTDPEGSAQLGRASPRTAIKLAALAGAGVAGWAINDALGESLLKVEWDDDDEDKVPDLDSVRVTGYLADKLREGIQQVPEELDESVFWSVIDAFGQPAHWAQQAVGLAALANPAMLTWSLPADRNQWTEEERVAVAELQALARNAASLPPEQQKALYEATRISYSGPVAMYNAYLELKDGTADAEETTAILERHKNWVTDLVGELLLDPLWVVNAGKLITTPAGAGLNRYRQWRQAVRVAGLAGEETGTVGRLWDRLAAGASRLRLPESRAHQQATAAMNRVAAEVSGATSVNDVWRRAERLLAGLREGGEDLRALEGVDLDAAARRARASAGIKPRARPAPSAVKPKKGASAVTRPSAAALAVDNIVSAMSEVLAASPRGGEVEAAKELAQKVLFQEAYRAALDKEVASLGRASRAAYRLNSNVAGGKGLRDLAAFQKRVLTYLLLGGNPGFFATNAAGDLGTAVVDGGVRRGADVFSFLPFTENPGIRRFWEQVGVVPEALREAWNALGSEALTRFTGEQKRAAQVFTTAYQHWFPRTWRVVAEEALPRADTLPAGVTDEMARGLVDRIAPLWNEQQVADEVARWADEVGLDAADAAAWSERVILPRYRQAMSGALAAAHEARGITLLHYWDKTIFDPAVELLFPYYYWMSRSIGNWTARMVDNPKAIAAYGQIKHALEEGLNRDIDAPDYLKEGLPISRETLDRIIPGDSDFLTGEHMPEHFFVDVVDKVTPLQQVFGLLPGASFQPYTDESLEGEWVNRLLSGVGRVPAATTPLLDITLALGANAFGWQVDPALMEPSVPLHWARPLKGVTAAYRDELQPLAERVGVHIGPQGIDLSEGYRTALGRTPRPEYEMKRARRYLADKVRRGEATQAQVVDALRHGGPLMEEAVSEAARYYGERGALSWGTGLLLQGDPHADLTQNARELGAIETLYGYGSPEQEAFMAEHPDVEMNRIAGRHTTDTRSFTPDPVIGAAEAFVKGEFDAGRVTEEEALAALIDRASPLWRAAMAHGEANPATDTEMVELRPVQEEADRWTVYNQGLSRYGERQWRMELEERDTPEAQALLEALDARYEEGGPSAEQAALLADALERRGDSELERRRREIEARVEDIVTGRYPDFEKLQDTYFRIREKDAEEAKDFLAANPRLKAAWDLQAAHLESTGLFPKTQLEQARDRAENPPTEKQASYAASIGIENPGGYASYELAEQIDARQQEAARAAGVPLAVIKRLEEAHRTLKERGERLGSRQYQILDAYWDALYTGESPEEDGPAASPPSQSQIEFATAIGIPDPGEMSSRELSQQIDLIKERAARAAGVSVEEIDRLSEEYRAAKEAGMRIPDHEYAILSRYWDTLYVREAGTSGTSSDVLQEGYRIYQSRRR